MLVGLDWAKPMMFLLLHVTCSCIPFFYLSDIKCVGTFLFLSLSLSLSVLVALWHQNGNPLCLRTLFVPRYLLLLSLLILPPPMSSFVMIKPIRTFRRTFHDATFIWNAKSFYRIFSILTFPLSSTVGVGSHCV